MPLHFPWPKPPAPGHTIEVVPGVEWARLPLPFELDHINVWLLADGAGFTVIDTGVGLPETRELWERIFATRLGGRPITRVLVTHFHPDHMGNAAWFLGRWPAELWCTEAEWFASQYVWRSRGGEELSPRLAHFRRHGVAEEGLERLRRRGNHYPGLVPMVTPSFHPIADGDRLQIGGRTWRVLTGRGHSPEHACLVAEDAAVLIAGDQVLPKITTNVSVWGEQPLANPLRRYLDSLARFAPLAPDTVVLPSHGRPFRGLHARLDQLRDHHVARLAEAASALVEPHTAAELVPVLFRRELDTHQLSFAVGEALAHLNFLEADGRIVRIVGKDGIHRFVKA